MPNISTSYVGNRFGTRPTGGGGVDPPLLFMLLSVIPVYQGETASLIKSMCTNINASIYSRPACNGMHPPFYSFAAMSAILLPLLLILPGTAAAPTLEWLSKYINCSTMESIDSRFLRGATKVQDWSGGKVCLLPLN